MGTGKDIGGTYQEYFGREHDMLRKALREFVHLGGIFHRISNGLNSQIFWGGKWLPVEK